MKARNEIFTMTLVLLFTISFTTNYAQEKKWDVPESSSKIKNPVKSSSENINIGKSLYVKHCKSCHGKSGEGDGTKAAELETAAGDFSSENFQSQTDGMLFYKTAEGRDDMPSFKKKIDSNEDIWLIVHYLRTFKAE
jgi:mono/diheme cytochrome c family protein